MGRPQLYILRKGRGRCARTLCIGLAALRRVALYLLRGGAPNAVPVRRIPSGQVWRRLLLSRELCWHHCHERGSRYRRAPAMTRARHSAHVVFLPACSEAGQRISRFSCASLWRVRRETCESRVCSLVRAGPRCRSSPLECRRILETRAIDACTQCGQQRAPAAQSIRRAE